MFARFLNNFLGVFSIGKVIYGILFWRFREKNRPLEAVIIHIDEYQRYIDNVQQFKNISWVNTRSFFKEMLQEIGSAVLRSHDTHKLEGLEGLNIPVHTRTSVIDAYALNIVIF